MFYYMCWKRKTVKLLKKSLEKPRSVVFEVSSLVGHPVDKIYDLFMKPSHEIKMFPNEQDFAEVDTRHTFSAKCSPLRTNKDNRKSTFVIFLLFLCSSEPHIYILHKINNKFP